MEVRGKSWAYFDVDGTLVDWLHENEVTAEEFSARLLLKGDDAFVLVPKVGNIRKLQELKAAGWTVVVWSQNGFDWAEAVLGALGIRGEVDFVLTKPHFLVDDLDPWYWLPGVEFF